MPTKKQLADALRALTATARTFRNVPKDEQEWTALDDEALEAGFSALAAYDAEEGMADKLAETERQLALYRQAMNEIDDRIEYTSFDKRTITNIMADLTAKLARK